ncbi:MAG: (Fe-S)-binding protein [Desulfobacterales bacterium]
MRYSAPENAVPDQGLDSGIAKLTRERIRAAYKKVFHEEVGARFDMYAKACVHCGLCSASCHYYLSHDGDPRWSPVGKVKQTVWEIMKKKGDVDAAFIRRAAEIAYTECNLCKRCTLYCPFGLDISYLMLVVRRFCHILGVTPRYIQDTVHSHSAANNQMWIKEDEWIDTIQWQEEEARSEIPDLRIPIEKEGADIMYSVIGPEPKFQAQLIYQAAVIMHSAGLDWTIPATPGWDNSDMAMFSGDYEIMARSKRIHFETAHRLRVRKIVMGECGHAFRSVYDMGNRALAWRMPPIPVQHAVDFYDELLASGKIRVKKKLDQPVTLHDPCNIVRGAGMEEKMRRIIHATCNHFIELEPNRRFNYCCGAGGGVINCGPPFRNKRVESGEVKARQLSAAEKKGARILIAPCHNCHSGLDDVTGHYGVGLAIKFLGDIIYEVMEK